MLLRTTARPAKAFLMTSTDATFADTLLDVAEVEGWMTPGQARLLWDAAQRVPEGGQVVEIEREIKQELARRGIKI